MHGDAKFGVVDGRGLTPSVFTLSLGAAGTDGSIPFHPLERRPAHTGHLHRHRPRGRVGRPAGARDDRIGYASDRVKATGFVASDPADEHRQDEHRQIGATGGFTAVRD
jgi:hypothetical protein